MRRVVIVVLDGLRRDLIDQRLTPGLSRFRRRAEWFDGHRSVFPSATRVASASFATGCHPGRHELQGNTLVLVEEGRLVTHDAGRPDFLEHRRRVTGRALAVPTLARRLAPFGGSVVFSNVSPGATYTHDPDGDGWTFNRAGSFGPGRVPLPEQQQLRVTPDLAGDRAMTERFVSEVLFERRPPLGILWCCEPDGQQHLVPLGSPDHHAALRAADTHFGLVMDAVDRLKDQGEDILFVACSDHGHQTVVGVVDVDAELIVAGLKQSLTSDDVVCASNGTAALIYVRPGNADLVARLGRFLSSREWVGRVLAADALPEVGQQSRHGLAFAVCMRSDEGHNSFGIAGRSLVAKPSFDKPDRLQCGQHGGLARFEQAPFLMIEGSGFVAGATRLAAACLVDVAPTILRFLELPDEGMDGRALQDGMGESCLTRHDHEGAPDAA